MRFFLFFLAGLSACIGLLAQGPDVVAAARDGQALNALFALANAIDTAALIFFLALPLASAWNIAVGAVLLVRGMDHIVLGTDIGLWAQVPGQGDTAGAVLVLVALVLFTTTLLARKDLSVRS